MVSIQWFADLSPKLLNPTGEGTQPSKPPSHRATEPPNHHIATNLNEEPFSKVASGHNPPTQMMSTISGPSFTNSMARKGQVRQKRFFAHRAPRFFPRRLGLAGLAVGDCSAIGARYGCQGYERQDCPLYGVLDWHYPKETGELRRGNGAPCGSWALRKTKSTGLKGP